MPNLLFAYAYVCEKNLVHNGPGVDVNAMILSCVYGTGDVVKQVLRNQEKNNVHPYIRRSYNDFKDKTHIKIKLMLYKLSLRCDSVPQ